MALQVFNFVVVTSRRRRRFRRRRRQWQRGQVAAPGFSPVQPVADLEPV